MGKQSQNGEGMDREWRGNRAGMERKWRGNEAEMEREWIGNRAGMDREWRGNGQGMEREMWGNRVVVRGNGAGRDPTRLSVPVNGWDPVPAPAGAEPAQKSCWQLLQVQDGQPWFGWWVKPHMSPQQELSQYIHSDVPEA